MRDKTSKLYNEFLGIYFDEYNYLPDAKRTNMGLKYDPTNLILDAYNYDKWYTEESEYSTAKNDEEKLDDLPPLEDYKEVKERRELKILTTNKLLTRLSVLLAQIKTGYNSNKLKNKIRQIVYFCINIIKSQKQFN